MDGGKTSKQREGLLDAAEGLIRDEGADGWSLPQLAERAGLALEVVQAEFESEWEVFSSVIRRDEWRFEVQACQGGTGRAGDRLVSFIEACVPGYDETYWIELWSLALRDERARALREELDEHFRDLIEEIVRSGVESGEFTVPDPRIAAITIASLVDSMSLQATLGDATVRPNYMLDACVAVSGTLVGAKLSLPKIAGVGGG